VSPENPTGQRQGSIDCTTVADTDLVSSPPAAASGSALGHPTEEQPAQASVAQPTTSTSQEPAPTGMSLVREYFPRMQNSSRHYPSAHGVLEKRNPETIRHVPPRMGGIL